MFEDGYLLAGSEPGAARAVAPAAASRGVTLATTPKFRDLLGPDGQVNVSALVYQNLAPLAKSAAKMLPGGALPRTAAPGRRRRSASWLTAQGPTLYYAYAEEDRIVFAGSNQNPLGLNLGTLAGFGGIFGMMDQARRHADSRAAQVEALPGRRSATQPTMSDPTHTQSSSSRAWRCEFGGRPILKGLHASLTGRCIGLLGPNGAGKTTLLHTLLGFHPPAAGTARIFGHDIRTQTRADPRASWATCRRATPSSPA